MAVKRSLKLAVIVDTTGEDLYHYRRTQRPLTRGDCVDGPRPCPWVGCSMHLYLDVNPEDGQISYNFPNKEVHEMTNSCALDIAARGGITLEEIADISNVTRERIRQIETAALHQLRRDPSVKDLEEQDEQVLRNRVLATRKTHD